MWVIGSDRSNQIKPVLYQIRWESSHKKSVRTVLRESTHYNYFKSFKNSVKLMNSTTCLGSR